MIQGIVFIEKGIVSDVYMHDDNDDIYIVDVDMVHIGMCPVCNEGLKFGVCPDCRINWNIPQEHNELANVLLSETADEQFLKGVE